jgi:uncharacterized membrane protein YkoI
MDRASLSCILLLAACGTASAPTPDTTAATPEPAPVAEPTEAPTPAPSASMDQAAPTPSGGTAMVIDEEIAKAAASAEKVEKMQIRTDATGKIVKQALYHGDAAQIPEPVKKLAEEKFPGGKVLHYETELYADGGRVYEVEVKTKDGKQCEVAADAEGKERYVECRVSEKKMPPEVAKAVKAAAPGAKVLEAEVKTYPDREEWSVEVKAKDRELYLRLKPDGTLIDTHLRIPAILEVPLP